MTTNRGWVAVVDEQGNHKQLTNEYATIQGIAWSRTGKEIWYTASAEGTDRQLLGVDLLGKQRRILTTPTGMRLLDIAQDGRVLITQKASRPLKLNSFSIKAKLRISVKLSPGDLAQPSPRLRRNTAATSNLIAASRIALR